MRTTTILLCFALLASGSVGQAAEEEEQAETAGYFFHRDGVARPDVAADLDECRDLASAVRATNAVEIPWTTYWQPGVAGLAGAAAAGFIEGLQRGRERRHRFVAAYRKCMQVKGYQRFGLDEINAKMVYAGGWEETRERLVTLATQPPGAAPRLDP